MFEFCVFAFTFLSCNKRFTDLLQSDTDPAQQDMDVILLMLEKADCLARGSLVAVSVAAAAAACNVFQIYRCQNAISS